MFVGAAAFYIDICYNDVNIKMMKTNGHMNLDIESEIFEFKKTTAEFDKAVNNVASM